MTLNPEEVIRLISNPDLAAEKANLRYVSEEELCVERKKRGRGFQYLIDGEPIRSSEEIERIKNLVIPPAWEKVRICPHDSGHLQVTGQDAKGRKQYIYHSHWTKLRNQTKFYKMTAFGRTLPKIRAQVEKDLRRKGMPREKVLALVIKLMEETHIRIGNESYARENKSYGLSTLRSRHVDISEGKLHISFKGKRGIEHTVSVSDRKLVNLVNRCEEIPGWEVFKYYNESGKKQQIDSGMINQYIQEISGEIFSAKDFRTWSATKIFFESVRDMGYSEDEKTNKKNVLKAYDLTAESLGNTRSVCRNYYVHPQVVNLYESGDIVPYFEKVRRKRTSKPFFSQTEEILLDLIKDFEIQLDTEED